MEKENLLSQVISLMQQKRDYLKEVFYITSACELNCSDDGIDSFTNLLNERKNIISKTLLIEAKLNDIMKDLPNTEDDAIFVDLKNEINILIGKILDLDQKNIELSNIIVSEIKSSIKDINLQKNINTRYEVATNNFEGSYFDKMN